MDMRPVKTMRKDAWQDERKTVSTQDYTGPSRFLADPLEYGSQSWLFRPGWHFGQPPLCRSRS